MARRTFNDFNKVGYALNSAGATLAINIQGPKARENISHNFFYNVRPIYYKTLDRMAMTAPHLSHLYEIGHSGSPKHRLYMLKKKKNGVQAFLKPATMLVPLNKWQRTPGATGRRVSKRYRFKAWPFVRELGITTRIERKPGTRWLAPGPPHGGGSGFVRGPLINTNKGPNVGAFTKTTETFFKGTGEKIMYKSIQKYIPIVKKKSEAAALRGAKGRRVVVSAI